MKRGAEIKTGDVMFWSVSRRRRAGRAGDAGAGRGRVGGGRGRALVLRLISWANTEGLCILGTKASGGRRGEARAGG